VATTLARPSDAGQEETQEADRQCLWVDDLGRPVHLRHDRIMPPGAGAAS